MTFRKNLRTIAIGLGASLLVSPAHAIAIAGATIQNSTGGLNSSSAAVLGQGKVKKANINALTGLFAGDEWRLLDRENKPSKPFNNVNFLLTADTGQRSGEWGVSWDGTDIPDYMDYVLVLKSGKKSGKRWGAYLFESASLGPDLQDLGGTFGISWLNKKGKNAKLRHASIFGRIGEAPPAGEAGGPGDGAGGSGDGAGGPGDGFDGPGDGFGGLGDGFSGSGDGFGGPGDGDGGSGDEVGGSGNSDSGSGDEVGGPDANAVPTPGSLALLVMGLSLVLMQLRQRSRN